MKIIIKFIKEDFLYSVVRTSVLLYVILVIVIIYRHFKTDAEDTLIEGLLIASLGIIIFLTIYILIKFLGKLIIKLFS